MRIVVYNGRKMFCLRVRAAISMTIFSRHSWCASRLFFLS